MDLNCLIKKYSCLFLMVLLWLIYAPFTQAKPGPGAHLISEDQYVYSGITTAISPAKKSDSSLISSDTARQPIPSDKSAFNNNDAFNNGWNYLLGLFIGFIVFLAALLLSIWIWIGGMNHDARPIS